jgi:lycopene cyclase domain-containing protein
MRHSLPPLRWIFIVIGIHIILALAYTTPWDNYLVATRVWYYNPALVSGILLGYVPLEEYIFFVLQSVFVGLWLLLWHRRLSPRAQGQANAALRVWTSILAACLWIASVLVFFGGWQPATYLSIMLFWGLPPVLLQLLFGADILWHYRRLLAAVILPLGLYLSLADSLAITASTWEINPAQSLGIFIGRLPLEEGLFFFLTVILLSFGMTLLYAPESRRRFDALRGGLAARRPRADRVI